MPFYDKLVKSTAAVVGLITSVGVGFGYVHNTYAQKSELKTQVGDLKQQFLHSERRNLAREKYALEIQMEKRKLSDKEKEQLKYLNDEIAYIDRQLKALQKQ